MYILLTTIDVSCVCSSSGVVCMCMLYAHPSECVYLCSGERDYKDSDESCCGATCPCWPGFSVPPPEIKALKHNTFHAPFNTHTQGPNTHTYAHRDMLNIIDKPFLRSYKSRFNQRIKKEASQWITKKPNNKRSHIQHNKTTIPRMKIL